MRQQRLSIPYRQQRCMWTLTDTVQQRTVEKGRHLGREHKGILENKTEDRKRKTL